MTPQQSIETDVAVAGAGLAGSLAALLLARQGLRVTVVDPHRGYPPDFRCEKLSGEQLAMLAELGLENVIGAGSTAVSEVLVARGGRAVDLRATRERGMRYDTLVNAVRAAWSGHINFIEGRVETVIADPHQPAVHLTNQLEIKSRLVVLSTGPGEKLRASLGLKRRIVRNNHSICIGFDLVTPSGHRLSDRALTYYGERAGDGIAFATFFPIGDVTRCNLFCHLDPKLLFVRMFRKRPLQSLLEAMPKLKPTLGEVVVRGEAEIRITDLYEIDAPERDGVVLIGDAQHTSCPVTGTGVSRVLTDAGQLCRTHVPAWFAAAKSAIDTTKVAQFYADPQKLRVDGRAAAKAERDRLMSVESGYAWQARRLLAVTKSRAHAALAGQSGAALTLRGSTGPAQSVVTGTPEFAGR